MNFLEVLKGTILTLKANKLRTFLTMLGIIIGIGSVITMWSIGNGGRENILGDLKKIGYGKFVVNTDLDAENFKYRDFFNNNTIEVIKTSKKFKNASIYSSGNALIKDKNTFENAQIVVSTAEYEEIIPVEMIYGRTFLPFEYKNNERVITMDNVSARRLFFDEKNALGKYVEVFRPKFKTGYKYKIVGVYKNPFESLVKVLGARDMPYYMRMPFKTYNRTFSPEDEKDIFPSLIVEIKEGSDLAEGMKEAKNLLEFQNNTIDVYKTNALSSQIDSFDKILKTLSLFITLAASISLFVGGIGVMNIMLVTVIERTKEIGIRKALGARNKDILKQFLFEAIILTVFGGLIGIFIGVIFALIVGKITGIQPVFSPLSIIISMSISIVVGIIFGVNPARKAAKLNPIDALRTE